MTVVYAKDLIIVKMQRIPFYVNAVVTNEVLAVTIDDKWLFWRGPKL